jgi:hypothetical protein
MSGGPYIHLCSHPGCGEWGGYGRKLPGDKDYVWRCLAHLWPDFCARPSSLQTDAAPSPPVKPAARQGRLL